MKKKIALVLCVVIIFSTILTMSASAQKVGAMQKENSLLSLSIFQQSPTKTTTQFIACENCGELLRVDMIGLVHSPNYCALGITIQWPGSIGCPRCGHDNPVLTTIYM